MSSHFALSFLFLNSAFHGRRDGGEPEWPPSPLRCFQALVAAAAARGSGPKPTTPDSRALEWLEGRPAPMIIAPVGLSGSAIAKSVPLNAMDIVASFWARGIESKSGDANPATHRTMKTVRPTWLLDGETVHYLWSLPEPLSDEDRGAAKTLAVLAGSVVVLGWGIDHVIARGAIVSDEQVNGLPGELWLPMIGDSGLRVPVPGTLKDLVERHRRFLDRLKDGVLTPPPPLSRFATSAYRRAGEPPARSVAAFSLLKVDGSGFRPFDTARRALTVAGMVRHATKRAAERAGWPPSTINGFVLGHGDSKGDSRHAAVGPRRFAYLPLPSLEARGEGGVGTLGSVRRVLLSSFADDCDREIAWACRALAGQELVEEGRKEPVAFLAPLVARDSVVRRYTQRSASWATVTPVVLPGFDDPRGCRRRLGRGVGPANQRRLLDRLDDRVDALLRKAIVHAGFTRSLADHAALEWRGVGFWPGAELAGRYGVPDHLRRYPRLHVKIRWCDQHGGALQVPGPICLGGGRFCGLGLFASEPQSA